METPEPIRILIVDDSRIFRSVLQSVLEEIPDVRVVGSVFSGEKAIEFIDKTPPDLVTLDVEMPGLGGLGTLREIVQRNQTRRLTPPVDTILVSALTKTGSRVTVEGLQLGALDFVCKPSESTEHANREALRLAIEQKLGAVRQRRFALRRKAASGNSDSARVASVTRFPAEASGQRTSKYRAIAIGASTGGPEALSQLLPSLTRQSMVPVFIVQHILQGLSGYLADSLSAKCGRAVMEARDDLEITPGGIYLAVSGKHMLVRSHGGNLKIGVSSAPPENGFRPSIDVFLKSASAAYGQRLVAVILTGMGNDGSDGIRSVQRAGGYVIAQDESSSVVWGMPRAAAETGAVHEVLPLNRMADCLAGLVSTGASR